jgi:alpha-glucosidase (family GH31 glycosyl hydrolase)
MAGQPLAQRLRDKDHTWEALRELIPGILTQGLQGYAFSCPDMIGGGEARSFADAAKFDPELVVRSAQVQALMPMMQFSVAPWRVLNAELAGYCLAAGRLHAEFGSAIVAQARHSARTGEPIVRPLEWNWPHQGYATIKDQFMLGDDVLVAPVVTKGARTRLIVFPPGRWVGDDGTTVEGPAKREVGVPLLRLPYYKLHRPGPST